jgi:hypothetical protein
VESGIKYEIFGVLYMEKDNFVKKVSTFVEDNNKVIFSSFGVGMLIGGILGFFIGNKKE